MAKHLEYLIIHCTATHEGVEISSDAIRKMHTTPKPMGRGWKQVGYSDMIHLDGVIENLVSYDSDDEVDSWEITNGVEGLNSMARHVVYVGGVDADSQPLDTRTPEQVEALKRYVLEAIKNHPDIKVAGHYQFANKACPSFNVPVFLRAIGVEEKNIYI